MTIYRGTGTASRFADNHCQNQVMRLEIEADDEKLARTRALREMRAAYPKAEGYSWVVSLAEADGEQVLPAVAWRSVNQSWTEISGPLDVEPGPA